MERTLQHWGIKGMRWGVRRYQNKDGSLTPAGKKRREQELSNEAEKAKRAEEAKRQHEAARQKAIKSGTATEVMKFRGELDSRELQTALDRLDREKRIRDLSTDEISNAKTRADEIFSKVDKATKYAESGIKAWNTIANIHNGLSLNGPSWAKIDIDVKTNNKKLRKAEQAAKDAEEKKAREKADEEAAEAKAEKEAKKAEKEAKKAEKKAEKEAKKAEKEADKTQERETIDMELDENSTGTPRYVRAGKDRVKEMFSEAAKKKSSDLDYDDLYTENGRKSVEELLKRYGY